jgi:hypothetical protein
VTSGEVSEGDYVRLAFEKLLSEFTEVRVAFVWHERLVVPASVVPAAGNANVLSYGLDMPTPIPDLVVDERGISATLSFSRTPCETFVPWEAVVGVRGYGEVAARPAKPARPKLSLVP